MSRGVFKQFSIGEYALSKLLLHRRPHLDAGTNCKQKQIIIIQILRSLYKVFLNYQVLFQVLLLW